MLELLSYVDFFLFLSVHGVYFYDMSRSEAGWLVCLCQSVGDGIVCVSDGVIFGSVLPVCAGIARAYFTFVHCLSLVEGTSVEVRKSCLR